MNYRIVQYIKIFVVIYRCQCQCLPSFSSVVRRMLLCRHQRPSRHHHLLPVHGFRYSSATTKSKSRTVHVALFYTEGTASLVCSKVCRQAGRETRPPVHEHQLLTECLKGHHLPEPRHRRSLNLFGGGDGDGDEDA